jgi:hypothetical protein
METAKGSSETARTAVTAARAWSSEGMVSMANRSTPPSWSPSACSRYAATASSNVMFP